MVPANNDQSSSISMSALLSQLLHVLQQLEVGNPSKLAA